MCLHQQLLLSGGQADGAGGHPRQKEGHVKRVCGSLGGGLDGAAVRSGGRSRLGQSRESGARGGAQTLPLEDAQWGGKRSDKELGSPGGGLVACREERAEAGCSRGVGREEEGQRHGAPAGTRGQDLRSLHCLERPWVWAEPRLPVPQFWVSALPARQRSPSPGRGPTRPHLQRRAGGC